MLRQSYAALLITILLSACATAGQGQTPSPVGTATDMPDVVISARQALSDQIGAPTESIETRTVEAVEWPDACLGLAAEGEMCAQAITPGYQITFSYGGADYQVHTDQSGSQVRVALPDGGQLPVAQETAAVQTWTGVTIPEAGLSFEVPEGWEQLDPAWRWTSVPGGLTYLGVGWADADPPTEPEAAVLPANAVNVDRVPVELGWITAFRHKLNVYDATGEGQGETPAPVQSVEYHVLITVDGDSGRRVIDFYASAPSEEELAQLEPLLDQMVRSLQPLTP